MGNRNREEIVRYLSNKYDLPIKKIEEIAMHQFKYVSKIMKKGDFNTIRLPYFGKFVVDERRVKHINRLKNNKK